VSRVIELRRVMELEVVLAELVPAVRRRIALEADRSLSDLHRAVQAAMGWHDVHTHRFRSGERLLGVPGTLPDTQDQHGIRVEDLLRSAGDRIEYLYDPRDAWLHEIRLERLRPGRPDEVLPSCLEGERSCPPESCGGPRAYAELVADLSQPESAAGRRAHQWLGGFFFPELFDLAEANRRLEAAFRG
jgi:hypothetical protein